MIRTSLTDYSIYGKCLSVTSSDVTLLVTLEVGPRIISATYKGSENVFYNDVHGKTVKTDDELGCYYGPLGGWHIYGGHRLWCAPESLPETYYPDNAPVDHLVSGDKVTLLCPVRAVTSLKPGITLDFSGNTVKVTHTMTNLSDKTHDFALWALSVMAPGGVAEIVEPPLSEGLLPSRSAAFWPYCSLADERFVPGKESIKVTFSAKKQNAFKIGVLNTTGVCRFTSRDGVTFEKRTTIDPSLTYPDFGCSCEIYTCDSFTELETISPMKKVAPGETVSHEETWSFS